MMGEDTTTVRVYKDDLQKLEVIKRRYTRDGGGVPQTMADTIRLLIDWGWVKGEDDETLKKLVEQDKAKGEG
jgi:hypothetical protein